MSDFSTWRRRSPSSLAFTVYPFAQMVWMSLHNWSLIAAKKYVGFDNFVKAWNDPQFWTSLGFTLQIHAADHADPDDRSAS